MAGGSLNASKRGRFQNLRIQSREQW